MSNPKAHIADWRINDLPQGRYVISDLLYNQKFQAFEILSWKSNKNKLNQKKKNAISIISNGIYRIIAAQTSRSNPTLRSMQIPY